jgi:hypothetical protein
MDPLPPFRSRPPILYADRSTHHSRARFSWSIFAWTGALVGVWLLIVLLVLPRFEESFKDYEIELPATTKAIYALKRIASDLVWLVLLASLPVAMGFAAGPLSPGGKRMFRLIVTLLMGGLVVFTVLAIGQPLIMLMENLSGLKK